MHTLPAAWYTQADALELEYARIFERGWQYAGLHGRLSAPGDFLTTTLGRIPAIVVRGRDGELRAFVNVCRHRGSELVAESAGCRQTMQCMYHGWTYNLDGTLRNAPRMEAEDGFDPGELSLEPLRLETVGPFVFVAADPAADPLPAAAGAWPELLRDTGLDLGRLSFRERRTYDVAENWKILVENFLERYHCPVSHHGFTDLVDLDTYEGTLHSDLFWHFTSEVRATAVARNLHGIADLPDARRRLWNFVLWPNFMANIYPGVGNMSTNQLIPLAPDRTLAVYDFYFEEGASEAQQKANVDFIDTVQREDIVLCESVQRGLRSGRFDRGRLLKSESLIDRFGWQVARTIADDATGPGTVRSTSVKL
ncbi:MAG: aromatic ring-hydroxylating dioxygenase subunit alpha [Gaiellales bacterium]